MGRMIAVNVATAATLLLLACLTLLVRDAGTLVPPPESVAKGLIRQLASHRSRQTRQYLSADARATLSPDRLASWFDQVKARTGAVSTIDGRSRIGIGDTADAQMVVHGNAGSAALSVRLVREHGLWLVADLPVLRNASSATPCGTSPRAAAG